MEALEHRHFDGVEFIRNYSKVNNLGTRAPMPIVFTSAIFNNVNQFGDCTGKIGERKVSLSKSSSVYLDNQVSETAGELEIQWDYVWDIFEDGIIEKMFDQYIDIIWNLIDDSESPLNLPLIVVSRNL